MGSLNDCFRNEEEMNGWFVNKGQSHTHAEKEVEVAEVFPICLE